MKNRRTRPVAVSAGYILILVPRTLFLYRAKSQCFWQEYGGRLKFAFQVWLSTHSRSGVSDLGGYVSKVRERDNSLPGSVRHCRSGVSHLAAVSARSGS